MSIISSLIILKCIFMLKVLASISVVDVGILPLQSNSVGIRLFIDIANKNRQDLCNLYTRCEKCCLIESKDCGVMTAFGEDFVVVKPKDRITLLYVAPMLQQHDLNGYCEFILNFDCNKIKDKINATIPFDTRAGIKRSKALLKNYIGNKKIRSCDTCDRDSLNHCDPVNCNLKYLGKRPVFDHKLNKCVDVPICLTDLDKELPDIVYVPYSNTCRNLDLPLEVQDIYAISTGLGTVKMPPTSKFEMKLKVESNCSTISQNLNLLRDLMYGRLCPEVKGAEIDYSECFKSAILKIVTCIISICCFLFLLVCCVNSTAWLYIQWSDGKLGSKWKGFKERCKRRSDTERWGKRDRVNSTVRNALLREVIVKDIPLELRKSVIDVCDRMEREVRRKRRYRVADVGSQVSLQAEKDGASSASTSTCSENEK